MMNKFKRILLAFLVGVVASSLVTLFMYFLIFLASSVGALFAMYSASIYVTLNIVVFVVACLFMGFIILEIYDEYKNRRMRG